VISTILSGAPELAKRKAVKKERARGTLTGLSEHRGCCRIDLKPPPLGCILRIYLRHLRPQMGAPATSIAVFAMIGGANARKIVIVWHAVWRHFCRPAPSTVARTRLRPAPGAAMVITQKNYSISNAAIPGDRSRLGAGLLSGVEQAHRVRIRSSAAIYQLPTYSDSLDPRFRHSDGLSRSSSHGESEMVAQNSGVDRVPVPGRKTPPALHPRGGDGIRGV